jgi:membrane-bound lytic murein transglycosylase MltF
MHLPVRRPAFPWLLCGGLLMAAAGCSSKPSTTTTGSEQAARPPDAAPAASSAPAPAAPASRGQGAAADDESLPDVPSPYDALPPESRVLLDKPFTGDFDEMVKRRLIRAGVVFNRTQYFIDKGVQRGMSYESIRLFEEEVNKRLKTGLMKISVAIVPLTRDQLFPALRDGKVDIVAAALTVTPERKKVAKFSNPTRTGVSEIVVTAPGVEAPASVDDLSGREVFVRRSSSYYEHLQALSASLEKKGKLPVVIKDAPEPLEDDDILEMVNAGLVETTVVDDYMVDFWRQVFPNVVPHPTVAVHTGGEIAVGVRPNNPKMLQAVNIWIKEYGPRTAFGNTMQRRYLESANYVKSAGAEAERRKLESLVKFFETYGKKYDLDYLLMAAQGYQESRLDHNARSYVGAIGVMQVMPATGKDMKVGDIKQIEPNIHAGVKYMRFMMDQYYKDEPMDDLNKALMTLASYNCGPGRMRQLRRETAKRGLNPNIWFGNVERVVSEKIGRETVTYVGNIYKYYVAYRLVMDRRDTRAKARERMRETLRNGAEPPKKDPGTP